jgi:hypothetical protein
VGPSGPALTKPFGTDRSNRAAKTRARPTRQLAMRREQTSLQVALIFALGPVRGQAAPETATAIEQARLFIERAETLGETHEDPALPYGVLQSAWAASLVGFNGDVLRQRAAQYLALAEKHNLRLPLMVGHYLMGFSLVLTGDMAQGRAHFDQALSLHASPTERMLSSPHFAPCTVDMLAFRSVAMWLCGYPEAALASADQAVNNARQIGNASVSMNALAWALDTHIWCGNYDTEKAILDELCALTEEKGAAAQNAFGIVYKGLFFS